MIAVCRSVGRISRSSSDHGRITAGPAAGLRTRLIPGQTIAHHIVVTGRRSASDGCAAYSIIRRGNVRREDAVDIIEDTQGLWPRTQWTRRGFVMTSLVTGFALSVQ